MDSQRNAKEQHRVAVLGLLHSGVHLTRGQIAAQLGITRSTISEVLTELQEEGAVAVSQVQRHARPWSPARRPSRAVATSVVDYSTQGG